jgi:hypothetical protein
VTAVQLTIFHLVQLALALALAGLILRGRARLCYTFTTYLAAVLLTELLVNLWPGQFWAWSFWHFRQAVFDGLKLGIAFELAYWIFLGFPGAAHSARSVILLILVGILLAIVALPNEQGQDPGGFLFGTLRPRLEIGAAWIFTALTGLVQWYRIPLHPQHKAIMIGFVPYLVVFSAVTKLVTEYGWSYWLITLDPAAYLVTCSWWAWTAWRREAVLDADPKVVARLQPWRVQG